MKDFLNKAGKTSLTVLAVGTGVLISALLQNITTALVNQGLENIFKDVEKTTSKGDSTKEDIRFAA